MDVVFSMWDMAGQEVYYATHQCFLSRNTLYLVVWNMEEGEEGIDQLQLWLLNIQVEKGLAGPDDTIMPSVFITRHKLLILQSLLLEHI